MAEKLFDGGGMSYLKRSLDAYSLRQRTIAENIANAETPGYRARSVEFESLLAEAQTRKAATAAGAARGKSASAADELPRPEVRDESPRAADNGVNNVSVDQEMAALAQNTLSYKMAARILALRYQGLRAAIRGRS